MYKNIKYIITFLFCLSLTISAYANTRTITTRQPIYNKFYNNPYNTNNNFVDIAEINKLEEYLFNRKYNLDNIQNRIERLEIEAFGCIQSGDILTRYENLRRTIYTRNNYAHNTNNTKVSNSILENLNNFFVGQMTGFTPQIRNNNFHSPNCYNRNNNNYWENKNYVEYNSPYSKGYYTNNFGTSNRSSIKILD